MALSLDIFSTDTVRWGTATSWSPGLLELDGEAIRSEILADGRVLSVRLDLVQPGDDTRVIHVLDIVQPRAKADGAPCFPGFLAPANSGGEGTTNVVEGLLVATSAVVKGSGVLTTPKEAVLDMSGPGADWSPFASGPLLVLGLSLAPGQGAEDMAAAIRLAALRTATLVARATVGKSPSLRRSLDTRPPVADGLPAIAVALQLGGEGPLNTNCVAGHPVAGMLPAFIRYEQMADGMVVAGNYTYAGQRNYTCQYQQNALLDSLYARQGADLLCAGVVLTRGYSQSRDGKLRMAAMAATLVERLGAKGVIITTEGAGNAQVDTMLTCQECERRGVRAVVVLNEMSDATGSDPGLVDYVPAADAIVTVGNREEIVELPPMPRVIGDPPLFEGAFPAGGPLSVPLRSICGATNEMGAWRVGVETH